MNFTKLIFLLKHLNGKTIYFNLKYFPVSIGKKFPVFIHKNVFLKDLSGHVILPAITNSGMIKVGFGDVGIFDKARLRTIWEVRGQVEFEGVANIGHGSKICVGEKGKLILGNHFNITAETSIICFHEITFGENCLLSWDILIMDTDFHKIKKDTVHLNPDKPILVGNNVWIGARSTILKGAIIKNGCVIAAASLINKSFYEENCILAGVPAKKINDSIEWSL